MSGATKLMTAGGGGVLLTPASSIASDVTVNVPSQNCTLGIQGPAFSAYLGSSSPTATSGVWTKVTFDTEEYDTNNNFASSRFTPNVAGYYVFNAGVTFTSGVLQVASLYKNGVEYKRGNYAANNTNTEIVFGQVYLNGLTDYVEIYVNQSSGSTQTLYGTSATTYFQVAMVRAA